ncbi:MAG TPA: hypothetical protein PLU30_09245 [Verrucomicrobiae bacterium]|nr:hypothetical protein [Verrucomicrobiae bacterium]
MMATSPTTHGRTRRDFIKAGGALVVGAMGAADRALAGASAAGSSRLRVASFRCDATPPLGETLVWLTKLTTIKDPLLAKGVVLEDGGERCVLCALDWCLLCNESEWSFREAMARAADTDPTRVAIQCIHQHVAPYADEGAHRLLDGAPGSPSHLTAKFLDDLRKRLGEAIRGAVGRLEPFDRVGCGEARVDRVASERRLKGADGNIIVRGSTGGRKAELASMPEGDIDPMLKTITFARGEQPLARLHYYATHPQTVSCDGSESADFVGAAREATEREEGVFQVYFTGCSGNVTVGKYNDETPRARAELAERLRAGMRAAIGASRLAPAEHLVWRTDALRLPVRTDAEFLDPSRAWLADPRAAEGNRVYRGAMRLATAERAGRPFGLSSLQMGRIHIVHLPGEPMLEFQRFAQRCRPDAFVAVAGYGDCGSAYLCTDEAFREGGYEPTATNLAPGAEPLLKDAIRRLLGEAMS